MKAASSTTSEKPKGIASSFQQAVIHCLRWVWLRPWLALPFLAIPALWPLFKLGMTGPSDAMLHLLRAVVLDHNVQQGMLYPRWVPELAIGLGYPVFNFYGPATYYLVELLHLVGLDFVSALMVAWAILILAAGFGMYRLAFEVFGKQQRWAALVAAIAYLYAPYLLTNVFIRGALAEVGAQAWLPWIFWSVRRILTAERAPQYVLPVAFTLGGLALTHNITLIFTPLVVVGYAMVIWWRHGRKWERLGWLAVAFVAAIGVSAFFWFPVLGEQRFLSENAFQAAASTISGQAWKWHNFLDTTFAFKYTYDVPFQLGLVQLLLALAGLIMARRRDPEWLYFVVLAVVCGLFISVWATPLWLSTQILMTVQFSWRLLIFLTLSLALFAGAILLPLKGNAIRFGAALAVILVVILASRPQLDGMTVQARMGDSVTLPGVTRYENDARAIGTGFNQEFLPRWNSGIVYAPSKAESIAADSAITISQANAYALKATVSSAAGGPLRFTSLYFPGWRVTLEDGTDLQPYPSTNLGLLTVDLPPGTHDLHLFWAGTRIQHLATWISLLTLSVLVILAWRYNRPRWITALPLALLLLGLTAAILIRPSPADVQQTSQPVSTPDLDLLGYRVEPGGADDLYIYPFWYVRRTPQDGILVRWQLLDNAGKVVSEIATHPYFEKGRATNWPPGTIVDDAYRIPLPPPLQAPPYDYELAVQVVEGDQETPVTPVTPVTRVGTVTVTASLPPQPQPTHSVDARFGEEIALVGFDVKRNSSSVASPAPIPLAIQPGDSLVYDLYWRALRPVQVDYHSFIHLVDHTGRPLVKQDQLAGSFFRPPTFWTMATTQTNRYALDVPNDSPSGLYWPTVGLYNFDTQDLLLVLDSSGQTSGDVFRLPPVKILGKHPTTAPQRRIDAQLGDFATLVGYDILLPETGLRAGSPFTVTLYTRSETQTNQDLTQFVQLYNPQFGMAAQQDAPPLHGANPTWAWIPGEIIVDPIRLTVSQETKPGVYSLQVGLYDPTGGARLPVRNKNGDLLPDGQVLLSDLTVQP